MKTQFIKDIQNGQSINDIFVIYSTNPPVNYRTNKLGSWLPIELSDKTGTMPAKIWGESQDSSDVQNLFSNLKKGDVVAIIGIAEKYQENPTAISIKPNNIQIKRDGEYDTKDFVASSENIEDMIVELKNIVSSTNNTNIKKLLEAFTNNAEFMNKFSEAPAAKKLHHARIGGLLEHVLSLMKISITISEIHSELDRDLLIAACLLHDIGKIKEYKITTVIDVTTEGRLLGHISIGQQLVNQKMEELGTPENERLKICHMILSHHGELSRGSPVKPAFPEAIAFHRIDDLDAQTDLSIQFKKNTIAEDWAWMPEFLGNTPIYLK